MDDLKRDAFIRVFADQAKKYYREWLAYRAFAEMLKLQGHADTVEALLADVRRSAPFQTNADAYDKVIDARVPPSASNDMDDALMKLLEALPSTEYPN